MTHSLAARRSIAAAVAVIALLMCLAVAPGASAQRLVLRGVGARPLTDAQAARLVHRSSWEPRPNNRRDNERMPTHSQLVHFRSQDPIPYGHAVTGHFTGTTDEIIQWAAEKWGFAPNLLRAVATVESWWNMSTVGNAGSAFGLFQIRIPYHCCYPLIADSTAFNADYYGAYLRGLYNGRDGWLNTVPRGQTYKAGDLWGSVGEWASGRWHLGTSASYVAEVRKRLAQRTWRTDRWFPTR
jgi:Transglycosylase SLT domain